jgi:protein-S-isoprenylcysteine O-methyltransferase Ste14
MSNQTNSQPAATGKVKLPWLAVVRLLMLIVIMLAVLFISAGRLDWWEAWAYGAQALLILLISRGIMLLKNPDQALERAEAGKKENVKSWDKFLMPLTSLYGPLVSWILAGLDVRFGWSPDLPDWIQVIALIVLVSGSLLGTWAMLANRFFSSLVRIQAERGHTVVDSGPYRFVRHPGYAGGVISWLAAPVFFSSYWLAIPSILMILANILRTYLEDKTLQEELPGYKEYTRRVRSRLIPGIW